MSRLDELEMLRQAVAAVRLFVEAESGKGFNGLHHPWTAAHPSRSAGPAGPSHDVRVEAPASTEPSMLDVSKHQKSKDPESALRHVRDDLGDCKRCKLAPGRKNLVFGVGNPRAELLFIGEAPGADEDRQGIPFVGKAGQLLTKIIRAMGLSRDDVYICNIIKCRPPDNRDPENDEIVQCEPFLVRQVEAIQPKVIVTLGRFAAQSLLQTGAPISRIRGRWHQWRGVPVMPTYHPAFLLRSPEQKRPVWEDMQEVMKRLGLHLDRTTSS